MVYTLRTLFSLSLLVLLAASLWPAPAAACTACSSGDPTLTAMGEEQPVLWRTRAGTLLRLWGERAQVADGGHAHTAETLEARLDTSLTVAPLEWLVLGVTMPLQLRQLTSGHDAPLRFFTPGDLDVGARAIVWKDRGFGPTHVLSAVAGVKLPTAPLQQDAAGHTLPLDEQVSTGSVDPRVGVTYSLFLPRWSGQAGAVLQVPTRGHDALRMGPSLRAVASAQYQATRWLGLRLGMEGRVEGQDVQRGVAVPGSGGAIGYVVPAVLVAPSSSVALHASVHVPAVATGSTAGELPTVSAGVLVDF